MPIYKFRNCSLDTHERLISIEGKAVKLPTKTFDVFQLLVKRAGKIVTKNKILEVVWKDCFVEEGNVAVHVSRIRKSLEQKLPGGRIIETVNGVGFRFLPVVRKIGADAYLIKKETLLSDEANTISRSQIRDPDGQLIINIEVIRTAR